MGKPSTVAYIRKLISTHIIDTDQNLTFIQKYYDEIKRFRDENPGSQKILPLSLKDVKENSLAYYYIKSFNLEKIYSRWEPKKGREFHSNFRKQISNHNTALISFVNHKKKDVTSNTSVQNDYIHYEFLDEAFHEMGNGIKIVKVESLLT